MDVAGVQQAMAGKPAVPLVELQKDAIKTGVRNAGGGEWNIQL